MRDRRLPVWNSFGSLGPDLSNPVCQMKRVNKLRVTDFSDQLREINKQLCKPRDEIHLLLESLIEHGKLDRRVQEIHTRYQ